MNEDPKKSENKPLIFIFNVREKTKANPSPDIVTSDQPKTSELPTSPELTPANPTQSNSS